MQGDTFAMNKPNCRFKIRSVVSDTLQGRIYRGIDTITEEYVAIKETWKALVALKQCRQGSKIQEDYGREISILTQLSSNPDCPSEIVTVLATWEDDMCYMYAMEFCDCCLFEYMKKIHENGHMKAYRESMEKLPQRVMSHDESSENPFLKYVRNLFNNLAHCVSYLHDKHICHLDLSLENVMLCGVQFGTRYHRIKIIDFGLAINFGQNSNNFKLRSRRGKTSYISPENWRCEYDACQADLWSLGVVLFVMLIGTHLYDRPCDADPCFQYFMKHGVNALLKNWRRLRLVNGDALDLFERIFKYEPDRINMAQLLQHHFLASSPESNDNMSDKSMSEITPSPSTIGNNDGINKSEEIKCDQACAVRASKASMFESDAFIAPGVSNDGFFQFGLIGTQQQALTRNNKQYAF
mmetsp:Transcript_10485/g.15749  ORF Transcript_10485/g.15749 Transcript_10485/m.15749 type:complete len:410 (-) Transcript_10485:256-1485(-)